MTFKCQPIVIDHVTKDAGRITVCYSPKKQALLRADYSGLDDPERLKRAETPFSAILEMAADYLEEEGLQILGGGVEPME